MREKEKYEGMDGHDIVMYIRDLSHSEEECERLLCVMQEYLVTYARNRMAETYSIPNFEIE